MKLQRLKADLDSRNLPNQNEALRHVETPGDGLIFDELETRHYLVQSCEHDRVIFR